MKHQNTYFEKRRHPRINKCIPFELKADDFIVVADTINLSCNGAYCQIDKYIPFMTNLRIICALPYGGQEEEIEYVECYGVVVRVDKVLSGAYMDGALYNIAIFFNEIQESEREKIANFIEWHRERSKDR